MFSNPDQLPSSRVDRTNYSGLDKKLSYGRPSFGYVSNSSALGMAGRNGIVSQSSLDTSKAIRRSNSFEASRHLPSSYGRQGSFGSYGL